MGGAGRFEKMSQVVTKYARLVGEEYVRGVSTMQLADCSCGFASRGHSPDCARLESEDELREAAEACAYERLTEDEQGELARVECIHGRCFVVECVDDAIWEARRARREARRTALWARMGRLAEHARDMGLSESDEVSQKLTALEEAVSEWKTSTKAAPR